ncbi:hypothetical protein QTP88_022660 [Uroleucon formosanum]
MRNKTDVKIPSSIEKLETHLLSVDRANNIIGPLRYDFGEMLLKVIAEDISSGVQRYTFFLGFSITSIWVATDFKKYPPKLFSAYVTDSEGTSTSVPQNNKNASSSDSSPPLQRSIDGIFLKFLPEKSCASESKTVVQCVKCEPKIVELKDYGNSSSNFVTHILFYAVE